MEIVHTIPPQGEGAFTCNTCGLSFPTADLQRLHMKTDWHRYNLKRKVASLPPVSSEAFAEKMLQQQQQQAAADAQTGRGSSGRSSGQRQKTKRDKKREEKLLRKLAQTRLDKDSPVNNRPGSPTGSEASMGSSTFSLGEPVDDDGFEHVDIPEPVMEVASEDEEDETEKEIQRRLQRAVKIPPNVCFVDGKEFDTVEQNVEYMSKQYGLFIPERDYLTDLTGLIAYLGEKIGLGNMCLYCGYQGRSVQAVRAHLVAKQHVKIPYESLEDKLEISQFYDFSSSYEGSRRVLSAQEAANADDADEWEDASDDEGVEAGSDDEDALVAQQNDLYVDESGYELALASGYRAGHRELARYYRQNLRPSTVTREGQGTVVAADTRTLLRARDPVQEKQQKQVWKETKRQKNIEYRRDKHLNFQKHFRDELLQ
uniref:ARAD1C22220p n=1 Tax=Blastobotrys adeninivorans TaxID=409370 RepID=A0A060T175_BLAAD